MESFPRGGPRLESSAFLSFDVTPREDGMQLSSVLRSRFGISRGMIRRLKQNDCAKVDGVVVPMRHRLRDGERVTLHLPPTLESNVEPEDVPLDIRYEDAHPLIVEKPAGMLVHPAGFEQLGTLANGVVFHLLSKGEPPVAGPVTRLDRGTSGLVLFAKHPHVHHRLTQDLRRDLVEREYIAIVHGKLADDRGTIDAPIRRIGPATSEGASPPTANMRSPTTGSSSASSPNGSGSDRSIEAPPSSSSR